MLAGIPPGTTNNPKEQQRMRNVKVVEAWLHGKRGRSGTGALRTDGRTLYSYKIVIGESQGGQKVVYDYRGPNKIGLTTTRHVFCAIREGGEQICVAPVPDDVDIHHLRTLVQPKTPAEQPQVVSSPE